MSRIQEIQASAGRKYVIALSKRRSRLALIASLITVTFSLYAITGDIVDYVVNGWPLSDLFHYFTINSNCLTVFNAFLLIPFAVEGCRKKYFSYPRWIAMLHYSGIVCTTLTMIFTVLFTSWFDPNAAFGGLHLYLHVLCPVMVLFSFFLVETGMRYSVRDALIAAIPSTLYMIIYIIEVVVVGKENGGWDDYYHVTEVLPAPVSFLLTVLFITGITLLIRWLYGKVIRYREKQIEKQLWPLDVSPVDIKIEIFGLGRYMGKHADKKYVELPLDMIRTIANRYSLNTEELLKVYLRGFLDSAKTTPGHPDPR